MQILRGIAVTALLLLLAPLALAQTLLTLNATGQTQAMPDEAVANLTVQVSAAQAALAQARVNKAMNKALSLAHGVAGLTATTADYNTYSITPQNSKQPVFTARQTLHLILPCKDGVPPPDLRSLLSALQQNGLMLNELEGVLSMAGHNQARQAAIVNALSQIRTQADAIANTLHQHVMGIKTLRVTTSSPAPLIRMQAMAKAAMPAPQSSPGAVIVSADITAEIELSQAK